MPMCSNRQASRQIDSAARAKAVPPPARSWTLARVVAGVAFAGTRWWSIEASKPMHSLCIVRPPRAAPPRPKRYDVLAEVELAPVPCRLLLAWERGCLAAPSAASSHACNFVKGELWLAGGRNVWVFRPTPRTRESSTRIPCCSSCPPSRCQRGDDHSTFGSPFGRDRRVMTIPAARSAAAEALAS